MNPININFTISEGPALFIKASKKNDYVLDVQKLDPKKLYIFSEPHYNKISLVASLIEHISFNPLNNQANAKYDFFQMKMGGMDLFVCSFPIEFKEVCARAAKVFDMTMTDQLISYTFYDESLEKTTISFPPYHPNMVHFEGVKHCSHKEFIRIFEDIVCIGSNLERLGVD